MNRLLLSAGVTLLTGLAIGQTFFAFQDQTVNPNDDPDPFDYLVRTQASDPLRGFVCFDLTGMDPDTIASASFFAREFAGGGRPTVDYFYSEDDSWTESSISWATQPLFDELIGSGIPGSDENLAFGLTFDVTALVKSHLLDGDPLFTFGFQTEGTSGSAFYLAREAASHPDLTDHPEFYMPQLRVTGVPEPASCAILAIGVGCVLRRRRSGS